MQKRVNLINFFQYVFVFFCFLCMYFFIVPQSDVFLFARGTDGSFWSAVESAVLYGNGRFLGNFISMFLSNHFEYAGLLIALSMTVSVYGINELLFKGDAKTTFLSTLIVAVPSVGIVKECYYLFAAYVNYMFPITLILLTLLIINKLQTETKKSIVLKLILLPVIFVLGFSSCLFSENTSFVLAALVFLLVVNDIINRKKIFLHNAVYFISVFLGSITMLLIPKITQTAWKLDHYREMAVDLPSVMYTAPGSFVKFSQIFNGFIPVIWLVSVAFLFAAKKYYQNKKAFDIIVPIFVFIPVVSTLLNLVSLSSAYIPWLYFAQTIVFVVFACTCLVSTFLITDKKIKWTTLSFLVLIAASIAPMMLVNQYGHRTYVITNYIGVFMGVYLMKAVAPEAFFEKTRLWKKQFSSICLACVIFVTLFLSSQTVYNFNYYAVRTNYIAEQINSGSEQIAAPILPCNSISMEDEWPNILIDISEEYARKIIVTDFNHCENADEYKQVLATTLPAQIVRAFNNLEFKDPLLVEKIPLQ